MEHIPLPQAGGPDPDSGAPELTRRGFLGKALAATSGVCAVAAALSPLKDVKSDDVPGVAQLLQKHYKEMTPEDKQAVFARIEADVEKQFKVKTHVTDPRPITMPVGAPGYEKEAGFVQFAYALNLSRCIGCRKCVYACVKENNQSRSPQIQYIRVLKMEKGSIDLETSDHHYDAAQVPDHESFYMPVQCHQCKKPPCVKVCPTEATWSEDDGIVVVDYDWCIGCRYCEAACPYWARRFNFATPEIPADELNPNISYLSNRPRPRGVMEKCTYCLHRTRAGRMPACVEVCPTGSRKFGDLNDPNSEVRYILEQKRVFVLKQEVGTIPRFFYYFDERGSRYREAIGPQVPGGAPPAGPPPTFAPPGTPPPVKLPPGGGA